jgi:hypothetical protein
MPTRSRRDQRLYAPARTISGVHYAAFTRRVLGVSVSVTRRLANVDALVLFDVAVTEQLWKTDGASEKFIMRHG